MALRNYSSTAAEATLTAGVNASATTLSVSSTTGFPASPFVLAIDAGAAAQELVLVTNVAGTNLTVTRGYDSTVAATHNTGAVVQHSHAAIDFREANTHVNATSGVHGVTGSVVGTTDTQTLTGKTIDLTVNTLTGTTLEFNGALTDGDFATLAGTETLTNKTLTAPAANGSLASFGGAWTDYVPTLTNLTIGNGSVVARYQQVGKVIHLRVYIQAGSTTTVTGSQISVSLPVAAHASGSQSIPCRVYTGTGTNQFLGWGTTSSGIGVNKVALYNADGSGLSAFATTANLDISGSYEAA